MEHDHDLKKINFDLLTPTPGSLGGRWGEGRGLRAKYLLTCCSIRDSPLFDMQHDHF